MKLIDRFVIKDKTSENTMRTLYALIEQMGSSHTLDKNCYLEVNSLIIELMITLFKRLDSNTTPAKTLLDFTPSEVKSACFKVGYSSSYNDDTEYVMAVMQELVKD